MTLITEILNIIAGKFFKKSTGLKKYSSTLLDYNTGWT